ncbi:HET-domain-containing protein [Hypoxylon sp. FL1284]|nr:HET-domain-containing protein [Hypoxylon sp. FL1284]
MPLAEESSLASGDPAAATRWSYQDPSEPALPDSPSSEGPFCAVHAATLGRLTRASFGPHRRRADGLPPPPLRDWHFGKLNAVVARRARCGACALVADTVDTVAYGDLAEVIACWVWDGVLLREGQGEGREGGDEAEEEETATLRLRIAPEMVDWESSFEPFDLVPLDTSPSSLFTARPVAASHFDVSLVRSWVDHCTAWHGATCADTTPWRTSDYGAPFIRLITLAENRLVESAAPPPYAALSYVWGSAPVFKTLQANIDSLQRPGALASQPLPKSIQDAVALARALGYAYLWVDSLCIVQDSPADKAQQIGAMAAIYSRADLAIVAASGDSASAGIPGLASSRTQPPQRTLRVSADLTLAALRPDAHRAAAASRWSGRGWTYQERQLSRRSVLSLPGGAVAFQCARAVWAEDYRAETPRLARCAPMVLVRLNRSWMDPGGARARGPVAMRTRGAPYLREYARLVEEYTARRMTFAGDRLPGIGGVLDVLRRAFGLRFVHGLPGAVLHMTLLWQPRDKLKRVPDDEGDGGTGLPLFPSWSWGGWIGPVGYEDWNEFNGLPELEARERRVIPLAKIEVLGSAPHLEAYCATKTGGELPPGWSAVATESDGICYVFGGDVERYHSVPLVQPPPPHEPSNASQQPHPLGLRLRTRVARFRLTNLIRTFDMNRSTAAIERRGRFGLAHPSSSSDEPWLGTILLPQPARYHARLARGQDYELIVLSESYGFSLQEAAPSLAGRLGPYAVLDVIMVRRVAGEELRRYRARLSETMDVSGGDAAGAAEAAPDGGRWDGDAIVERIGVGRMLKSAWEDVDAWESFILV